MHAHLAGFGLMPAGDRGVRADGGHRPARPSVPATRTAPARATLPYGIAIAAGGVAVIVELMKL